MLPLIREFRLSLLEDSQAVKRTARVSRHFELRLSRSRASGAKEALNPTSQDRAFARVFSLRRSRTCAESGSSAAEYRRRSAKSAIGAAARSPTACERHFHRSATCGSRAS